MEVWTKSWSTTYRGGWQLAGIQRVGDRVYETWRRPQQSASSHEPVERSPKVEIEKDPMLDIEKEPNWTLRRIQIWTFSNIQRHIEKDPKLDIDLAIELAIEHACSSWPRDAAPSWP